MGMTVLNIDLDNTLIYSYKHDIGPDKINVERYHGREISYITGKTFELLKELESRLLIVPTSTRTIEQYERIRLGIGEIKYALVCNGGILLENGKSNDKWYQNSLKSIRKSVPQLHRAMQLLESEPRRKFELRFIEELFIFTKCEESENIVKELKEVLDNSLVDIFHNGEKVYVVPVDLQKGNAVARFQNYIHADKVIAAGDSEFDISMLKAADVRLAPYGFTKQFGIGFEVLEAKEKELFSEYLLDYCKEREGASH